MVYRLTDDPNLFPDPHYGEPDGLIAVGGDLRPERLLTAYCNGIFPWYGYKEREHILWWCPMNRFVIFPKEIHVSHSMRQLIHKSTFHATINQAFAEVTHQCSINKERNKEQGAWLGKDMIEAYTQLHKMGFAVSIEVWNQENHLVGGLYGINIGRNFFGESMFSNAPSASKFALIHLSQLMEKTGGIIDCQFETPHLLAMGGRYIPYDEYMKYLRADEEVTSQ